MALRKTAASPAERILAAADKLFYQQGIRAVGVDAIVAESGVSKRTLYNYYATKDDLIAEAISQMFDESYEVFRKRMEDVAPAAGLLAYIDGYLSTRHREARQTGCPIPSLSGDLARMPAAARRRFEAGTRRLTDSIADILRTLKRRDPETLAASVLAEMVGALAISRAVSSSELSEQILKSARDSIKVRLGLV